jgi:AraC-like DNA-binding protein
MVELAERILLQPSGAGPRTVKQAAACLGVADKTLHEAFVAVRGTSPGRHLQRRRLQLVRDALLAEPHRRSPVKWFAMAHGFRHLSNFAHAYHVYFGELPSETVARAKGNSFLVHHARGHRRDLYPAKEPWDPASDPSARDAMQSANDFACCPHR